MKGSTNLALDRGLTTNDVFSRLMHTYYHTLIDVSSKKHSPNLDEKQSCLISFVCLFGRYRYARLSFCVVSAGDMFQKNGLGIANDILGVGFDRDGTDHDETR